MDALGGFEEALTAAREEAGLAFNAPVKLEFYPCPGSIWKRLVQGSEDRALRQLLRTLAEGRIEASRPQGAVWQPPMIAR